MLAQTAHYTCFVYTFISNHHIDSRMIWEGTSVVKMGDMYECSILVVLRVDRRWVDEGGGGGQLTDCISNSHAKDC